MAYMTVSLLVRRRPWSKHVLRVHTEPSRSLVFSLPALFRPLGKDHITMSSQLVSEMPEVLSGCSNSVSQQLLCFGVLQYPDIAQRLLSFHGEVVLITCLALRVDAIWRRTDWLVASSCIRLIKALGFGCGLFDGTTSRMLGNSSPDPHYEIHCAALRGVKINFEDLA